MSLPEQGAKVATGVVDALRSQPMVLALIVLNAIVLLAVFWSIKDTREKSHELTKINLEQLAKAQDLLAKCVPPDYLPRRLHPQDEHSSRRPQRSARLTVEDIHAAIGL
jgi:hypothetical protein